MTEGRVAREQTVERRARDLEQLGVAHRLHSGRPCGSGQECQLAEGRSRPELPHRPLLALAGDDDPQTSGEHDEEAIRGIALVEEPLACLQVARGRFLHQRRESRLIDAMKERHEREGSSRYIR
jgi:hypothetical protein